MKNTASVRSKWITVMCLVVMMAFLSGCGYLASLTKRTEVVTEPEQVTTAEEAPAESIPGDYSEKPDQQMQYMASHPVRTTVRYDLNGDGIGEDITVFTSEFEAGQLIIGETSIEIWSCTPTGYFTVLNVDDSVDRLLVGISDYGPSDDPETIFYAYDGTSIREVGYLTDIFGQNVFGYDSAVCHGDGTVTAGKRWDVLGTWNSVGLYEVSQNGIKDITDFYPFIDWDGNFSAWEVTSKVNLLMYDPSRPDDAAVTVPAGTVLAMTGLQRGEGENLYWVTFEVESMGKTLGMSVERIDRYTCICTEGGFVTSEEAFDGFFYAG